jgi:ABC-type transport system substrate-binding protein
VSKRLNAQKGTYALVLLLLAGSALTISLNPAIVHATVPGTTLNVGLNRFATIPSLNPYSPTYVNPIDSEMYLRCIHVQYAPAIPNGDVLCNSSSSNANYTAWTLNLIPGLKWSDGSPLNATDLAWSLLDGNATGYFSPYLSSVKILNSTAVTATVPISQPDWLTNLENIFIVPHENFGSVPLSNLTSYTAFTNGVGAGPYILPSYTQGANPLIMVPNPYYYQGNNQYYSQVAVHIFSSLQSMQSAMLAGQISIMWFSGTSQAAAPFNNVPGVSVFEFTDTDNYQIFNLNYLKAPLNNESFRQGLAYATDRNALATTVNGPDYSLINYGLAPTVQAGENTYPYNTTLALQAFAQDGLKYTGSQLQYPNGTQVSLTLSFPSGEPDSQNIATLVTQQWAKVGILVNSQLVDATTLYSNFGTGNWQIATLSEDGTTGTPIRYSDQLQSADLTITTLGATPGTPATADQFVTPQIGNLILNQSLVPTGSAAYNALTAQISPLVAQQVVAIPLYTQANIIVYSSSIFFGANNTDPNLATGIYNDQSDVQEPFAPSTFYVAEPVSAMTSTSATSTSTSTTSTSTSITSTTSPTSTTSTTSTTSISTVSTTSVASSTTTTSSTSSSTALNNYIFPVLAIALFVIATTGVLASSRRRSRISSVSYRKADIS